MTIQIDVSGANIMVDAFIDAQGTGCRFEVWSSAAAAPLTPPAGVKLVDMVLPDPFTTAASGGSKAKTGTWQGVGITDGAAASFRLVNGSGAGFMTGSIGLAGSGADAIIDAMAIVSGQVVSVASFAFTIPGF